MCLRQRLVLLCKEKKKNVSGNNRVVDNYLLRRRGLFLFGKSSLAHKLQRFTSVCRNNWLLRVTEKQNQHNVSHHRASVRRPLIVKFIKVW